MAWIPPISIIISAPATSIAYITAGAILPPRGGEHAITAGTPAALAVAILIMAEQACANRPPGI